MTAQTDPFRFHPNLRDKIIKPENSFFRNFRAAEFVRERPEFAELAGFIYPEDFRDENRRMFLAQNPGPDLWVFGYGSLMWDPAFEFAEVRRAYLPNYSRQFILLDTFGARGDADAPGLMAALDHGEGCQGLLFRIAAPLIERESDVLWQREMFGPAYIPQYVTAETDHGPVFAMTFVADHSASIISCDLTPEQKLQYICTGRGFLGSSLEYLTNIASHFAALKIADEEVDNLMAQIKARGLVS